MISIVTIEANLKSQIMSRTLLSILFMLSFSGISINSFAQSEKGDHEINLGIGLLSADQIYGTFAAEAGRDFISLGTEDYDNTKLGGAISLSYKHYVKDKFAAGLTIVTDRVSGDVVDNSDDPVGSFKRHYFTIAPEIKYVYSNKESFRFYGILGAGITFGSEDIDRLSGDIARVG